MQLKEFGVSLGDLIHEFNFEVVYGPEGFEKIEITKDDVNRPGLQLAGFFDYFDPNRIQVMGKVESSYVEQMESEERRACFDLLFETRIPVLLISGNHDSPERLAFGNRLLDASGIHISPVYDGQIHPVILQDEHGPVHFWLLPFIKPAHVKRFLPDEPIESYTDACRAAIAQMNVDFSARNVLVTHQFVTGANTCESEELSVGGADNVDASVFEGFDYVALGHLHSPQKVGRDTLRYCGTPLKYSFSEASQHKSVTFVELGEKGSVAVAAEPLVPRHDLRELRGSYMELTDRRNYEGTAVDDYLHITLTDEQDVPDALAKLRLIYPNLMRLDYDNLRTREDQEITAPERAESITPLEHFSAFYQLQNNQPLTAEQAAFCQQLIEEIWKEGEDA